MESTLLSLNSSGRGREAGLAVTYSLWKRVRMSRSLRIEFPGTLYQITGRGNACQRICRDDADRKQFLATLDHVVDRYDWLCQAYCLMDNHGNQN